MNHFSIDGESQSLHAFFFRMCFCFLVSDASNFLDISCHRIKSFVSIEDQLFGMAILRTLFPALF